MKKLYFIRHGLTEMNVAGLYAGTCETPLTAEGRKQANAAGQHAKGLDIDYIVCSPLSRARETAKIIAKQIGYPTKNIHSNQLFAERHFGALEGQPWNPDLDLDGIADVETRDTLLERAWLALMFLKTVPAHNILVVSHGQFGRALRNHLHADKPFDYDPANRLQNAELVRWV